MRFVDGNSHQQHLKFGPQDDVLPLTEKPNEGFLAQTQELCIFDGMSIGPKVFVLDNGPIAKVVARAKVQVVVGAAAVAYLGSPNHARLDNAKLCGSVSFCNDLVTNMV